MPFSDDRDYVIATMLPNMAIRHETAEDEALDFVVDEARQLYVDNLPLLMNHQDGEMVNHHTGRATELTRVGTVLASSVVGNNAYVLGEIDPDATDEGTAASNLVAKGHYASVSLGNTVEAKVRASATGRVVVVKTPEEVSLCRRGARHGSTIHAFCPGRSTLERLQRYEPDDLEVMIDKHAYRQTLVDRGLAPSDGERYISALYNASRQRLAEIVERDNLHQRPCHLLSSDASAAAATMSSGAANTTTTKTVKASSDAAAATDDEVADTMSRIDADADVSKTTPPVGTAAGEGGFVSAQQRSSEATMNSVNDNVTATKSLDAAAMAQDAIAARRELLAAKQALADERSRNAEELADYKRMKEEQRKLKDDEYKTIIKSAVQHAIKASVPPQDIEADVADLNDKYNTDPDRGIAAARRAAAIMVKAAASVESSTQNQQRELQSQVQRESDDFLSRTAAELRNLQQADAAISLQLSSSASAPSAQSSSSFSSSSSLDSIKEAIAQEKTAFESRWATGDSGAANDKKRSSETESAAATAAKKARANDDDVKFSVKASADGNMDARAAYIALSKQLGRPATYAEVAYGAAAMPTGRTKASVSGAQVPEMRLQATRSKPAYMDASTFSPNVDAWMTSAMRTTNTFGSRGGAIRMLSTKAAPVTSQARYFYEATEGSTVVVSGDADPHPESHVL